MRFRYFFLMRRFLVWWYRPARSRRFCSAQAMVFFYSQSSAKAASVALHSCVKASAAS